LLAALTALLAALAGLLLLLLLAGLLLLAALLSALLAALVLLAALTALILVLVHDTPLLWLFLLASDNGKARRWFRRA
jgi:hypothetical protein